MLISRTKMMKLQNQNGKILQLYTILNVLMK